MRHEYAKGSIRLQRKAKVTMVWSSGFLKMCDEIPHTYCAGLATCRGGTPTPRMDLLLRCVPVGWKVALFRT